jgi:hypothetical protein
MRYQWQDHKTRNMATLHTDVRMPSMSRGSEMDDAHHDAASHYRAIDSIMSVPGVEGVLMRHHSLTITKGTVFGWPEIRPAVERIVRDAFDPGGEMVPVGGPSGEIPGHTIDNKN